MQADDIAVIGGFLSFFLVLFVNKAASGFDAFYNIIAGCQDHITACAVLAKNEMPIHHARRLIRYMNATYCIGFVAMSDTYTKENTFDAFNEEFKWLTEEEYERIVSLDMEHGGTAVNELTSWSIGLVGAAKKETLIDSPLSNKFRREILALQAKISSLFGMVDQPISFFYVHFLHLLSALYIPLFAISAAYNAGTGNDVLVASDIIAGTFDQSMILYFMPFNAACRLTEAFAHLVPVVVVFATGCLVVLQILFVMGLRVLGEKMVDPLGDDLEDLSIITYIRGAWIDSVKILGAMDSTPVDADTELDLVLGRQFPGPIFESKSVTQLRTMAQPVSAATGNDSDDDIHI